MSFPNAVYYLPERNDKSLPENLKDPKWQMLFQSIDSGRLRYATDEEVTATPPGMITINAMVSRRRAVDKLLEELGIPDINISVDRETQPMDLDNNSKGTKPNVKDP